jgi:hypothetical protein
VGAVSDTDLADWLARQYDTEAAAARACLGEAFVNEDGERKDPGDAWPPPALKRYTQPLSERGPWPEWVVARVPFIETWSPQRVLAEIAAKRLMLAEHGTGVSVDYRCRNRDHIQDWQCERAGCPSETTRYCEICGHDGMRAGECRGKLLLAMPYGARPGFEREWKIDV